jgi:hypothetical protein
MYTKKSFPRAKKTGETMDQTANVILSHKVEERTYQFIMPVGAPFGEAYDAAFKALDTIMNMAKDAVDKQKREETPKDTVETELVSN